MLNSLQITNKYFTERLEYMKQFLTVIEEETYNEHLDLALIKDFKTSTEFLRGD